MVLFIVVIVLVCVDGMVSISLVWCLVSGRMVIGFLLLKCLNVCLVGLCLGVIV